MQTNQSSTAIQSVDVRLVQIESERSTLQAKRKQAQAAKEPVIDAQAEVQAAKYELENQQSEAFITGVDVDLAPFTASVTRAEKRLADANKTAAAARAALPRIGEKLEALDAEVSELQAKRTAHVQVYWKSLARDEEAVFLKHAQGLVDSIVKLRALDRRTTESVGYALMRGLWSSYPFRIPVGNGFTQDLNLNAFNDPCIDAALARLEAVFDTSIRATAENRA